MVTNEWVIHDCLMRGKRMIKWMKNWENEIPCLPLRSPFPDWNVHTLCLKHECIDDGCLCLLTCGSNCLASLGNRCILVPILSQITRRGGSKCSEKLLLTWMFFSSYFRLLLANSTSIREECFFSIKFGWYIFSISCSFFTVTLFLFS